MRVVEYVMKSVIIWLHDVVSETIANEYSVATLHHVVLRITRLAFKNLDSEMAWKLLFRRKVIVECRRKCVVMRPTIGDLGEICASSVLESHPRFVASVNQVFKNCSEMCR